MPKFTAALDSGLRRNDENDFDETHPAPWEWDLKRLAASFAVAGRDNDLADGDSPEAATSCVRS